MTDQFKYYNAGLDSIPVQTATITPNDNADLPNAVRCINVATDGKVRITAANDADGTYTEPYFAAGMWHGGHIKRIWNTGTTATGITGGW